MVERLEKGAGAGGTVGNGWAAPAGDAVMIDQPENRFRSDLGWLESRHSFNFGSHFRPDRAGHGLLVVLNDDVVSPGRGFGMHPHSDMEIVTWVLSGRLEHRDSAGNRGVIRPGEAQRMSAGTGIRHSEMNHAADEPVHFLQMWVVPDTAGVAPGYEQRDINRLLDGGELVAAASGRGHEGAVSIHQSGAVMWVARPRAGAEVVLPDAPYVHLYVAAGSVEVAGQRLEAGAGVRLRDAGPVPVGAGPGAEIIVWESDRSAR